MNIFYNKQGIGDILLLSLKDLPREKKRFDRKGNVARIYNQDTNETVGYNIFSVSDYLNVEESGSVTLSKELIENIQTILNQNGYDEKLNVDLSPKFVVGYIKEKVKHPNADKLSVCTVDIGNEILQIVCGAPNVGSGQKVVVAKVGAVMPSGLVIKDAELRGVASSGMICSARELDLPNAPQEKGILVLSDEYEAGQAFFEV
ncbi:YtpR family tRNA-binding protein [Bacillus salitolerans]|uniref:YtpR family tRNA-binding protein n=1 Tax=Bacillus salitolerans TaxID=1437434 RepID=A0ABW4LWK6_9BACI